MTRKQIENIATKLGWRVTFTKNPSGWYVEFESYTDFGQDVIVPVVCSTLGSVPDEVELFYENFDVEEAVSLWIGPDGHGKKGAPYHIRDIVKDMEEAESMIHLLATELKKL